MKQTRLHVKAFQATFDWVAYLLLKEIYQGQRPAADILYWVNERIKLYPQNALPLLYNGQESGLAKEISLFERDIIQWENQNKNIYDFCKDLIRLRRENAALSSKVFTVLKNDHSQHVLSFLKSAGYDDVLVILNFSSQPAKLKITLPAQYHIPEWQNLLNTGITKNGQELANIELKPYQVGFWKRE